MLVFPFEVGLVRIVKSLGMAHIGNNVEFELVEKGQRSGIGVQGSGFRLTSFSTDFRNPLSIFPIKAANSFSGNLAVI